MIDPFSLSPMNYDGVVSALVGNGELCTTLAPTGFHVPPSLAQDRADLTQHFVMAGRRKPGPDHPFIQLGKIWRNVVVNGVSPEVDSWEQRIEPETGSVWSTWQHVGLNEKTLSCILWGRNAFVADTTLQNSSDKPLSVSFTVHYHLEDTGLTTEVIERDGSAHFGWTVGDLPGNVVLSGLISVGEGETSQTVDANHATFSHNLTIPPGVTVALTHVVHFSDRMHFEPMIVADNLDPWDTRHENAWREFIRRAEITTGDQRVDEFRRMTLYTLKCQATPWSIPPTLSSVYWGGGAFHDEMYPFLGLLASGHADLARRIPYYRLATLPAACLRGVGQGALYPWSATEAGEERDPNGHWLTERFHMGQFAVCIRALWEMECDIVTLEDLYPVLHEIARFYESNVLERDVDGFLGTRPCTDFDESVGEIRNGPFTICAVIAALEMAAQAANMLEIHEKRSESRLLTAQELKDRFYPQSASRGMWSIPEGKSLHSSVLGPVFPFRVDVDSPRALKTAAHIHHKLSSERGWKPGESDVFEGTHWMWTAGHLATVHAWQNEPDLAWEAVSRGPLSAGPMLSPNEHVDRRDEVQVPWFTTGCGAWLCGLYSLVVIVRDDETQLLMGVPASFASLQFGDVPAGPGLSISGLVESGKICELIVKSDRISERMWTLPGRFLANNIDIQCRLRLEKGESDLAKLFGLEF